MNNLNRITLINILISSFCFVSCVSLKTPKRTDLVELNAPMLIGKYPLKTSQTFRTHTQKDTVVSVPVWYFFKNSEGTDSVELAQATHIKLEVTDKKHATATLYNGNIALKTGINKGRFRKGYFRMKHELSFSGVPPFYWSMNSSKMQFGLGKQGELFIDEADETNGSILIIMAGTGGFTTSYTVPKYLK